MSCDIIQGIPALYCCGGEEPPDYPDNTSCCWLSTSTTFQLPNNWDLDPQDFWGEVSRVEAKLASMTFSVPEWYRRWPVKYDSAGVGQPWYGESIAHGFCAVAMFATAVPGKTKRYIMALKSRITARTAGEVFFKVDYIGVTYDPVTNTKTLPGNPTCTPYVAGSLPEWTLEVSPVVPTFSDYFRTPSGEPDPAVYTYGNETWVFAVPEHDYPTLTEASAPGLQPWVYLSTAAAPMATYVPMNLGAIPGACLAP